MSSTQPIIVVGSGASGSVLALYLARAGIPVIVLEKAASLPRDLRSSTFHPPTLEMLHTLGVAEDMIAKGLVVDRYQYRDRRTGEVAEFDMSLIADETRFPFRLQLEQYEMTWMIRERLRQYPHVQVFLEHQVLSVTQDGYSVTAEVRTPEGIKHMRAPFIVGADGAGSNVRKSVGIDFGGFTYDEKFLVISTPFRLEDVFDNLAYVNYVADPNEWCVILRTEKIWRIMFPVVSNSPEEDAKVLAEDQVQARLHRLHDKPGNYEIGHRTLYKVHQRVAETYFKDRVVLAGDACHINNPLGGMGMNGGIHDAYNLAGKLVDILAHGANHLERFSVYDRQRRELAVRFVQEHTINNKKLMESTDPDIQNTRQKMLMETAADPVKARAFILERAMIDCVRESLAVH